HRCGGTPRDPALKNKYGVEWRLEVNFPKFDGDLYGRELTVTFLHFLHGEKNYAGLDALKQGIAQDVVDSLDHPGAEVFALCSRRCRVVRSGHR
ncbi:riboflavin kinase, partial [Mycobacterium tuberculosis]|nr:riboflavin kinase [Mycobacterium tuberculosis]